MKIDTYIQTKIADHSTQTDLLGKELIKNENFGVR